MLRRFRKHKLSPQIFDLLQLSRKEREVRNGCSAAIKKFYDWKKSYSATDDPSLKLCGQIEGMLLRRQAHEAVMLYRLVRKKRILKFQEYIDRLPERKHLVRAA